MAESTGIGWADSTFNSWIGCTKVSPACDHCYAAVSTPVRTKGIQWGPGQPRTRTSPGNWKLPVKWNREPFYQCADCGHRGTAALCPVDSTSATKAREVIICAECGGDHLAPARRRVFCASLSDWLDNEVPIEWLVDLLDLIRRTPNLDWLLLTKRIGNWKPRLERALMFIGAREVQPWGWLYKWVKEGQAPANVWLGATVVNQAEADRDVPKLLRVPARIRFLSVEPMLGAIQLYDRGCVDLECGCSVDLLGSFLAGSGGATYVRAEHTMRHHQGREWKLPRIDWLIAGGESGPKARPAHPDWFRALRNQCASAGAGYFFKQWGEYREYDTGDNTLYVVPLTDDADKLPSMAKQALAVAQNPVYVADDGTTYTSLDDLPENVRVRMVERVGTKNSGNLLDGRRHEEFPA